MAQTHPNVDSCDAGPPDCQSMGNSSVDSWTDSTASLLFLNFLRTAKFGRRGLTSQCTGRMSNQLGEHSPIRAQAVSGDLKGQRRTPPRVGWADSHVR